MGSTASTPNTPLQDTNSPTSLPINTARPSVIWWWVIGLGWLVFAYLTVNVVMYHVDGGSDFGHYCIGATRLLNGIPVYTNPDPSDTFPSIQPMLVLQTVSGFMRLANGDCDNTKIIWFAFNMVLLAATTSILSSQISNRRSRMILWTITPLFIPVFHSFWMGQISIVMYFFTVAGWSAYKRGQPILTGILLALLVWTKFYPGLFLVYFLWKCEWKVVISAGITTLVLLIVQSIPQGFNEFIAYFTERLPELLLRGQPEINHANQSILGFAQKMFSQWPQVIPVIESPLLVNVTRYGLTLLLLGTLYYYTRHAMTTTSPRRFDLEYTLVMLCAMLLGSTLWVHGMPSALLTIVVLMQSTSFSRQARRRMSLYLLVAVMLITLTLFITLGYLMPPSDRYMSAPLLSTGFFGMMCLWALTLNMLIHTSTSTGSNNDLSQITTY